MAMRVKTHCSFRATPGILCELWLRFAIYDMGVVLLHRMWWSFPVGRLASAVAALERVLHSFLLLVIFLFICFYFYKKEKKV
jgi:hypothetical protein